MIDHITNNEAKILLQAKPLTVCNPCTEKLIDSDLIAPRVIPEDVAFLMNSALMGVIQQGTAHDATVLNRKDIAGKTGTTNDKVDAWFAGYSPNLVVTVWVGFDTPRPLYEYASKLALPVWIDFMKIALKGQPEEAVKLPPNVVEVRINPMNGLLAKPDQQNTINEYFRENEVPSTDDSVTSSTIENTGSSGNDQEHLF